MSAPKLTRIVNELAARAATILTGNGFYSDMGAQVFRDRRPPQTSELPCVLITLNERSAVENLTYRARCDQTVTVTGFRALDGDSEPIGIEILADIQRAIETSDETLGGLLMGAQYGLQYASDEIFLPDTGESVVAGQIVYSIPHIRRSGDPDIA